MFGPSISVGYDLVWIGAPCEGPCFVFVVLLDEAIDDGLPVDEGVEDAVFEALAGELCEDPFHGVQPGARSGVKWKDRRGCRASPARTRVCLWAA